MILVFVWRGGVKHCLRFPHAQKKYIYDPRNDAWIGPRPPQGAALTLVDDDVWSGRTLLHTKQRLEERGWRVIALAGNRKTGFSHPDFVDLPAPTSRAPLVVISGRPGTGKSALAHQIAAQNHGVYIKWASFVGEPGKYGERAAAREAKDPLVFAKKALDALKGIREMVVLDGVKDARVAEFLAYATNRPLIPIFVSLDEDLRRMIVSWRGDADDRYAAERERLFAYRLAGMHRLSIALDMSGNDHGMARSALAAHGIEAPLPVAETVIDKRFLVQLVRRQVFAQARGQAPHIPNELVFHHRYSERYIVTDPARAHLIDLVASAFRIIDDIVDEHLERRVSESGEVRFIPALWPRIGAWGAAIWAIAMLRTARDMAPDVSAYDAMIRRVAWATLVELDAEAEGRPMTDEEYQASLDKEIAFREWLASLIDYDSQKARREAIVAQMKNDRYAQGVEKTRLPHPIKE